MIANVRLDLIESWSARLFAPGSFMPEDTTHRFPAEPTPDDVVAHIRSRDDYWTNTYAFTITKLVTVDLSEVAQLAEQHLDVASKQVDRREVVGSRQIGARYYMPGSEVYTAAHLEALVGQSVAFREDRSPTTVTDVLVSNIRSNSPVQQAVLCVTGNWQPLEEGDVVL
jgi:hypothetical protein